ncbi:leucyl/phenylalanyl-tRNA--protein transferase [Desulfocurvus sp. DL9XJH121]
MPLEYIPPGSLWFPDPERGGRDGLLAFGGDLAVRTLVLAYSKGLFPWYGPGDPILWWSPDPRLVLAPDELHVPRSLRRVVNSERYEITLDTAFPDVIRGCATAPGRGIEGTWLLPEMIAAYEALHRAGFAHSVEARLDGELVGGLYGVAVGRAFFGESMFFRAPDASKVAFVWLARLLGDWGYGMIDCQQTTGHLLRFGAREVPRSEFLERLAVLRGVFPDAGSWTVPERFKPL